MGEPGGTASQKHYGSLFKSKGTSCLWSGLGGHTTPQGRQEHDAAV